MLMALLYSQDGLIVTAAPACDQFSLGDRYWLDCHEAELGSADLFETAYLLVDDADLQARLLRLGIDSSIDGEQLTREVQALDAPLRRPRTQKAA